MTSHPERDAAICDLLGKGTGIDEVAQQLGVTRGVVAGVRRRAGGVTTFGRKARPITKPQLKLAAAPQPSNGTCKWIDGDPSQPGWHFCGKLTVGRERSWCEKHRKRVYQRSVASADARPFKREWTL